MEGVGFWKAARKIQFSLSSDTHGMLANFDVGPRLILDGVHLPNNALVYRSLPRRIGNPRLAWEEKTGTES
jgi:hypothetical protein